MPRYLDTIPTDPFDGHSLRYRLKDGGAVVYSIGPNLRDDGGEKIRGAGGPDVAVVLTKPVTR